MATNIAIWTDDEPASNSSLSNCEQSLSFQPDTSVAQDEPAKEHTNSNTNELHLNFWMLKNNNFLDIGVKLPLPRKDTTLYCFIEADHKKIIFEDLGMVLHEYETVRHAVFNDVINMDSCRKALKSRNKIYEDSRHEQNTHSAFCIMDIDDKDINNFHNGTLISIPISGCETLNCCNNLYVRFRLAGECIDQLLQKEKTPITQLAYHISSLNVLDLRINMIRTLPSAVVNRMYTKNAKFNKIQCFFMGSTADELSTSMFAHSSVRVLEKTPWCSYLPSIDMKKQSDIVAYQWKAEDKKDFSLFLKIITHKNLVPRTMALLVFFGFTSWITGKGADALWKCAKTFFEID